MTLWFAVCRELGGLDDHGSAIAENLGRAYHRSRVVSNADDRICTKLSCVRDHQLKGFFPGGFTKVGEYSDPPSKERAQSAQNAQR